MTEEPYAEVKRLGRWSWSITVIHGITSWGPDGGSFHCWGNRERAERKAQRKLAEYHRSNQVESFTVQPVDGMVRWTCACGCPGMGRRDLGHLCAGCGEIAYDPTTQGVS